MSRTRLATALFALSRVGFGVGLMARPERVASGWIGSDAEREPVKLVVRGLGARDVALSAGTLASLGHEDRLAPWIAAAIACDLSDIAATLATPADALPGNARWGTVGLAGAAAAGGVALLAAVRR